MNCLDFHREKLADPRRLSAEALAHEHSCPACTAFARSVDETERGLQRALDTPVPDGLADRVLLRAGARRPARWLWALAATVLLSSAVGVVYLRDSGSAPDQYARLAIEHVVMEPESFTSERHADPEALRTLLKEFGGTLKAPLGTVRYVKLCPLEEGGTGWHIVLDTPEGLATILLIQGKPLEAVQTASAGGWSALVRPTARGYYAVITASGAATSSTDRRIREQVEWDARAYYFTSRVSG